MKRVSLVPGVVPGPSSGVRVSIGSCNAINVCVSAVNANKYGSKWEVFILPQIVPFYCFSAVHSTTRGLFLTHRVWRANLPLPGIMQRLTRGRHNPLKSGLRVILFGSSGSTLSGIPSSGCCLNRPAIYVNRPVIYTNTTLKYKYSSQKPFNKNITHTQQVTRLGCLHDRVIPRLIHDHGHPEWP